MKSSDIFIKALEEEGVEYIFGIPGEENLDFLNFQENPTSRENPDVPDSLEAPDFLDVLENPE